MFFYFDTLLIDPEHGLALIFIVAFQIAVGEPRVEAGVILFLGLLAFATQTVHALKKPQHN